MKASSPLSQERWAHQFHTDLPVFASVDRDGMQIFLTEHAGDCEFVALVHFNIPSVGVATG